MSLEDERAAVKAQLDYLAGRLDAHDKLVEALPQTIAAAVAAGLSKAISDPAMWDSAIDAMQKRAQATAGSFVLGGLGAVLKRGALFVLIGVMVYLAGGWSALVSVVKAIVHGGGQ